MVSKFIWIFRRKYVASRNPVVPVLLIMVEFIFSFVIGRVGWSADHHHHQTGLGAFLEEIDFQELIALLTSYFFGADTETGVFRWATIATRIGNEYPLQVSELNR